MTKTTKNESTECKDCRFKAELELAHAQADLSREAGLLKLLGHGNVMFTVTETKEYRSDVGAAIVAAVLSGQLAPELVESAIETVGNLLAAQVASEAAKYTKKL